MTLQTLLWKILAFGALPAWLLAGGADWLCHRRSGIERTSGARESWLHLVLYLEIAVPAVLGLWLQVNAGLLAIMALGVLAHMATSWWDTSFSQPRRFIAPIEQQVHSWLEMLPLFALVIVAAIHATEFSQPRWILEPRDPPLTTAQRWGFALAMFAGLPPIIEELLRGLRYARVSEPAAPRTQESVPRA
jgi:hypothetical protein